MRNGSWVTAVALVGAALGCRVLEQVPGRLFDHRTPRERYEASLQGAGLAGTALVRDWTTAAERALREAPAVKAPHVEEAYLPPAEPAALALRVKARRGQRIRFETELPGDSVTLVFLEAWEVGTDSAATFRQVATADSGERAISFEPRQDGEFVFRVQPELLRGGRLRMSLQVGPILTFPILNGRDRDVGSRFGAPRDGGARDHHGIDIFAPRGTVAVAAAEANVVRVETTARGGKVVWLRDRRGNALYYAHLDRQHVSQGDQVTPGDTIGWVGNTGNAVTSPPHLHFGVYRRGEGPVDPWWFVHRPPGEQPPLAADTTMLGAWTRTPKDRIALRDRPDGRATQLGSMPRHTAMRVLAAVGDWYRVRLPDRTTGYVIARSIEPALDAVETATLKRGNAVLSQPGDTSRPAEIIAEMAAGDSVAVLGRFGDYLLMRTPAGRAGWVGK